MVLIAKRRILQIIIAVCILVSILFSWQAAKAYLIIAYWQTNNATFYYDSVLPTKYRSGTDFGASVWTNVSTSSWTWTKSSGSSNKVKEGYVDGSSGSALAVTSLIINVGTGYIISMEIKIDKDEEWYTGSGTPAGWQYDFRSAIAHEFGHGLGLAHTNVSCSGTSRPTMCPVIPIGTTYFRTLATDDKNGVSAMYP